MLLKGSLLALLIVSVCADDHPIIGGTPNTNRSPDNSNYDDVDNTVTYSNRRRYGGGKPTQVSSSVWASGRARTGRVRAKAGRRRRWGRPARTRTGDNSRVKPSGTTWGAVQESYSSGSSSDSGYYNADPTTESYNSYDSYDNDYDAYQNDDYDGHQNDYDDYDDYDGHQNDYDDYDGYQNDYDEKQDGYNDYDKDVENYQTCTKSNRNICCDLGYSMSEASKRTVCETLGCEYDKCQWRDDGYGSDESKYEGSGYGADVSVTSGGYGAVDTSRSGGYDSGGDEEVSSGRYSNGDGGYSGGSIKEFVEYKEEESTGGYGAEEDEVGYEEDAVAPTYISSKVEDYQVVEAECDDDAKTFCCSQNTGTLKDKISICEQLSCSWQKCGWGKRNGWKDDGHEPTQAPTKWEDDGHEPTSDPTSWKDDGHYQCDEFARDICCDQDDDLSVKEKEEICDDLGCIYDKCGWKKDGYDDEDDSKPRWKSDGYDEEDNSEYKNRNDYYGDYSKPAWKNDGFNEKYKNKSNQNDYYDNRYQKNKFDYNAYGQNQGKYNDDYKNAYEDDQCTADEREECCTANEKKKWQVCKTLGCNIKKCDKKEGGWDDEEESKENKYESKNVYDKCTASEQEECCSSNKKKQWQVCKMLSCSIEKCDITTHDNTNDSYGTAYGDQQYPDGSQQQQQQYYDPAPRYEVFPKYSDLTYMKPTMRPTYRPYVSSTSSYNDGYRPTMRPTYRAYPSNYNNVNNGYTTLRPTYRKYATSYDANYNAYPDQNMYPNDPSANVYPNAEPSDGYPRQYVDGSYGH